ncbi:hypothetical protein GCM10025881_12290 [Pseudolysinimonas kribbensis]|uniref:DNA polymerase III gamma subunit domain-containing protein n=1 Tax=Pseudolysinimonas kribbensis TaxID=433641 RepID=A0ABQ6K5U3_9MICO|nr:hypothetical protein GCM10025881_12290 [Pseudolysinimonas kribbensis]
MRDTLSLLDQLIAGSEGSTVEYERAVGLLGYTHAALLDEVVDAIGAADAPAAFGAIDRVIQTGQDPRRFVEDLLERLRDLIVVAATRDGAGAVLRGVPQDEIDRMGVQATAFGGAELSRAADVANTALTEMTGATSPRLHLELMIARLLVPAADDTDRGALARLERLERRVGIEGAEQPRAERPGGERPRVEERPARPDASRNPAESPRPDGDPVEAVADSGSTAQAPRGVVSEAEPPPVTLQQLRDAWPEILEVVQRASRGSWLVVYTATPRALDDDVLTLGFRSQNDVAGFRPRPGATESVSEHLRSAIADVLGLRVKFLPRVEDGADAASARAAEPTAPDVPEGDAREADAPETATPREAASETDVREPEVQEPEVQEPEASAPPKAQIDADGWAVVSIPASYDDEPAAAPPAGPSAAPRPAPASTTASRSAEPAAADAGARRTGSRPATSGNRYGEAVVRELLKAEFIEEQQLAPRDAPVTFDVAPDDVPPVAEEDR